jgi:hypothetical protein
VGYKNISSVSVKKNSFYVINTLAKEKVVVDGPAITKLLKSMRSFKRIFSKILKT